MNNTDPAPTSATLRVKDGAIQLAYGTGPTALIAPGDIVEVHGQVLGADIERVHRACFDANKSLRGGAGS